MGESSSSLFMPGMQMLEPMGTHPPSPGHSKTSSFTKAAPDWLLLVNHIRIPPVLLSLAVACPLRLSDLPFLCHYFVVNRHL